MVEQMILQVEGLSTHFQTHRGAVCAVDGVSLAVGRGETVALVGESGCGKSTIAASIMRLVPPPGRIVGGEVRFEGEDLLAKPPGEMRRIRGRRIGMIFQEPLSALNPTLKVGTQITEALRWHGIARGKAARERAVELLDAVGIPAARERLHCYPHELSGGMRQRVMIAAAIACGPDLVIADEPTTALDVTLQAQIMELLADLKEKRGLALLLVTHDLGVVATFADRAAVMYAGRIVAEGPTAELIADPLHPYTRGLLGCVPRLGRRDEPLVPIGGSIPDMVSPPAGCRFAPRCPCVMERCLAEAPALLECGPGRKVRCHLYAGEGAGERKEAAAHA